MPPTTEMIMQCEGTGILGTPGVCVCVCARAPHARACVRAWCVRMYVSESACACVCVRARVRVRACVRACVQASVGALVRECLCVRARAFRYA